MNKLILLYYNATYRMFSMAAPAVSSAVGASATAEYNRLAMPMVLEHWCGTPNRPVVGAKAVLTVVKRAARRAAGKVLILRLE